MPLCWGRSGLEAQVVCTRAKEIKYEWTQVVYQVKKGKNRNGF